MGKRKTQFWESARLNNATFLYYYNRLLELAISRFEWYNLPETCDSRFLELSLACSGAGLFVKDTVLESIYSLRLLPDGDFDMYGNYTRRVAWGYNGTQIFCTEGDSVLVYNNMLKRPIMGDLEMYALRLYECDRTMDVNIKAQKTPVLILCDESERLSMENLYQKYDGNTAVIFGKKGLNVENIQAISTESPFVAPELNGLKNKLWNEALTYLGIYNVERKGGNITVEEVQRNQGGVVAQRFGPLHMRQEACKKANEMWGTDFWCEYRNPNDYGIALEEDSNGYGREMGNPGASSEGRSLSSMGEGVRGGQSNSAGPSTDNATSPD